MCEIVFFMLALGGLLAALMGAGVIMDLFDYRGWGFHLVLPMGIMAVGLYAFYLAISNSPFQIRMVEGWAL